MSHHGNEEVKPDYTKNANDELRITTKNLIFNLIQTNKTTLVAGNITPRTTLLPN